MGRRTKSLSIIHPEGQKYACRDCPARCCTSWAVPVTKQERGRILADDEALLRLGSRGVAILGTGVLPMRERGEKLACVFLDEDDLCSLHKRHGHEFLPAPCQAFPFAFAQNEKQQPVALLSRYCPSIRDNYGEPVEGMIEQKLQEVGLAGPLSEKMGLRSGRVLPRAQYITVLQKWREVLGQEENVAQSLCRIYDLTDTLDERLPPAKRPNDQELAQALATADVPQTEPLRKGSLSFGGRMLVSHLLGGLCYPSRVMLPHRIERVTWGERLHSWGNRLVWLLGWGSVRLLFVPRPVRVRRMRSVNPVLGGPDGRLIADYLMELIDRRQGFAKQTYLSRVIVDMALMAVVISRFARAAASAEGLRAAEERHVKEGIGIAELLFSHQGDSGQSTVLNQLRLVLMSNRTDFRRLLSAEI